MEAVQKNHRLGRGTMALVALPLCIYAAAAKSQSFSFDPQENSTETLLIGAGMKTCGDFIAVSQEHAIGMEGVIKDGRGVRFYSEHARYLDWGMGYITAMLYPDRVFPNWSFNAFDLSLRNYCNANPTAPFAGAVHDFFKKSGIPPRQ